MYLEFYKFNEKPFNLSPSSKYLYLGDIHKEALALLTYGVIERMGFILLTGEVGTGKTTMVHALLNSLGDDVQYVYLSNPLFSVNEFMDYLAFSAFKKKLHFQSKADFLIQFESFLKERLQNQKNFILIIDEAQKLSIELLEEIRLLSNMETADEKLINIFLIGQPELNDTLNRMECRPLLQRISVRYHIKPLDQKGTSDYLLTRLKMAGAEDGAKIFPRNTVKEIYKCSGGYPRLINILADNMLVLGYSRNTKKLTPDMAKECYNDLQLSKSPLGRKEILKADSRTNLISNDIDKSKTGRNICIIILIIIAVIGGIYGKSIYSSLTGAFSVDKPVIQNKMTEEQSASQQEENNTAEESGQSSADVNIIHGTIGESVSSIKEKEAGMENNIPEGVEKAAPGINSMPEDSTVSQEPVYKTVTVRHGETLEELTMKEYGYVNDELFDWIKENNPEIENIHQIGAGQTIKFPSVEESFSDQIYTVHIASFTPFKSARELFNELTDKGYETYIIPVYNDSEDKIFRVTVGTFKNKNKAEDLVREIKEKDISNYSNVISLETH